MMTKNLPVHRVLRRFLLLLLTGIFISATFAQVKFYASTVDRTIGKNDYLQIDFTVENATNVESIDPPLFKNFVIVSGPNHQSSMSNINGNIRQSLSVGFVLKPVSTGNFTIGAATAKVDGKQIHSSPITITVTNASVPHNNAGSNPSPFGNFSFDFPSDQPTHQFDDYILQKNENVAAKIKKNLFIRIEVSKKNCYVGEPLIANYKLYTRLKSESNVTKAPSFNGFSVSELELPDNYTIKTEKLNGREYNVYTLRKVQLYPLQPGKLSLEPVEVKNKVTFLKAESAGKKGGDVFYELLRDFANENAPGDAIETQMITIGCDTAYITVKPLPEVGKPGSFKGAVGSFKINAELEKNNFTTDDAGSMKLIISGSGNIQLINAPVVKWPLGVEGFESKTTENVDKFSVPMKGEKIFTFPFTVNKEGDYTISPVTFSYFDVASESYKEISTQPVSFHVTKGTGIQKIPGPVTTNIPISHSWYENIYPYRFYLFGSLLLAGALLVLVVRNLRQSRRIVVADNNETVVPETAMPAEEFVIPANPLAEAESILGQGDISRFYKVLDQSFHKYLSEKLKVPVEELTRKKINERMDKCNVGVGTSLLVNSLLEDIEVNLYAPVVSETQMQDVYEKASEAVSLLDKQVC